MGLLRLQMHKLATSMNSLKLTTVVIGFELRKSML